MAGSNKPIEVVGPPFVPCRCAPPIALTPGIEEDDAERRQQAGREAEWQPPGIGDQDDGQRRHRDNGLEHLSQVFEQAVGPRSGFRSGPVELIVKLGAFESACTMLRQMEQWANEGDARLAGLQIRISSHAIIFLKT